MRKVGEVGWHILNSILIYGLKVKQKKKRRKGWKAYSILNRLVRLNLLDGNAYLKT